MGSDCRLLIVTPSARVKQIFPAVLPKFEAAVNVTSEPPRFSFEPVIGTMGPAIVRLLLMVNVPSSARILPDTTLTLQFSLAPDQPKTASVPPTMVSLPCFICNGLLSVIALLMVSFEFDASSTLAAEMLLLPSDVIVAAPETFRLPVLAVKVLLSAMTIVPPSATVNVPTVVLVAAFNVAFLNTVSLVMAEPPLFVNVPPRTSYSATELVPPVISTLALVINLPPSILPPLISNRPVPSIIWPSLNVTVLVADNSVSLITIAPVPPNVKWFETTSTSPLMVNVLPAAIFNPVAEIDVPPTFDLPNSTFTLLNVIFLPPATLPLAANIIDPPTPVNVIFDGVKTLLTDTLPHNEIALPFNVSLE